jgi:hypothetical protein
MYVLVAETMMSGVKDSQWLLFERRGASWLPWVRLVIFILAGVECASALLVFGRPWLWRRILSATALRDPAKVPSALFSLHLGAVVPFAAVATLGILLFLLSGRRIDLYPLLAVSAAGMVAQWPQNRQLARLLSGIPQYQGAPNEI